MSAAGYGYLDDRGYLHLEGFEFVLRGNRGHVTISPFSAVAPQAGNAPGNCLGIKVSAQMNDFRGEMRIEGQTTQLHLLHRDLSGVIAGTVREVEFPSPEAGFYFHPTIRCRLHLEKIGSSAQWMLQCRLGDPEIGQDPVTHPPHEIYSEDFASLTIEMPLDVGYVSTTRDQIANFLVYLDSWKTSEPSPFRPPIDSV